MERGVVVDNKALEEFRGRLERWDELCAQLKELYYRYLDLAAFRSEKCLFPGRRCVRSWNRQYDAGDLTLMWTYIANTAPLCGKLIEASVDIGYFVKDLAIKNLEKYGDKIKRPSPDSKNEIITLEKPVHVYLVLWENKLYAILGEFDDLPKSGRQRLAKIRHKVLHIISKYERRGVADVPVKLFDIDNKYERLWLEVPLPKSVSALLGKIGHQWYCSVTWAGC